MKMQLHCAGWLLAALCSAPAMAAPAGSLDPDFGELGRRQVGYELGGQKRDIARTVLEGPAGRLYLVGGVDIDANKSGIGISRLYHDGDVDTAFGQNGKVYYHEPAYEKMLPFDAAFQSDGKLVVVGDVLKINSTIPAMLACRFDLSGAIDTSFGDVATPGCRAIGSPFGLRAHAESVLIQSDDKIVLAGNVLDAEASLDRAAVVRLLSVGTQDAGFGNQISLAHKGVRILFQDETNNFFLTDITQAPQPDGGLVGTGYNSYSFGTKYRSFAVKMRVQDGAMEPSFNGIGAVNIPTSGSWNDIKARSVKVLPDGAVLVAGELKLSQDNKHNAFFSAKLNASGGVYPGFGSGGAHAYNTCAKPCSMNARDLQIYDDGSFAIVGTQLVEQDNVEDFFAAKLLPNGNIDGSFGLSDGLDDGLAYVDFAVGDSDVAYRALLQGGRLLMAGSARINANENFAVARLDHGITDQFTVTTQVSAGGSLSPAGPQLVTYGDRVDFVATPQQGFSVLDVSGCGIAELDGIYTTEPITADCIVTVEFTADFIVTYNAGPHGFIVGEAFQTAPPGGNVKPVEAVGDTGYHFTQWDDGVLDNPRQDTYITQNIDVTALFEANLNEVAPNPGLNGTMWPDVTLLVPTGDNAQFTIQPYPGFAIGEISGCAGTLQGNVFTTDTIVASCDVTVTFVASNQMYSLDYQTDGNGTIDGVANQSVLTGADGSMVTAVPNIGFQFATWSDGMTDAQRQETHVVMDIAVTAIFVSDQLISVTPSVSQGGSISPAQVQFVPPNEQVVFTLTPADGFVIQSVDGTCGGSLVGNIFTTAAITANCTVIANFVADINVITGDALFSDGFEESP
jgi:uncharacterized delta-60 repeat protein